MNSFLILFFALTQSFAAIYGTDDRQDVKDVPFLKKIAPAVAVQVSNVFLENNSDGTIKVTDVVTQQKMGLCASEKFSNQPSVGDCTGFLVSPTILITAGHCNSNVGIDSVSDEYCKSFSWFFDYNVKKDGSVNYLNVPQNKIYHCIRAIRTENIEIYPYDLLKIGTAPDFAVLELDRPVEGVEPLTISKQKPVAGDLIYTVGHPWGLPAKYSGSAKVINANYKEIVSVALDTLGGNSGGPVFNSQNQIVGILTSGHQNDAYMTTEGCERLNTCDDEGKNCVAPSELFPFNEVQHIEIIFPYLENVVVPWA